MPTLNLGQPGAVPTPIYVSLPTAQMRVATPQPSIAASTPTGSYDAIFSGDSTGATDVTAALTAFLAAGAGKRLALAVSGTYRCDNTVLVNKVNNLTLDFRGSRIQSNKVNGYGLQIAGCSGVTLNDPKMTGRGYAYDDTLPGAGPSNNEHLLAFTMSTTPGDTTPSSNCTINRPVMDHSYGDAIYARDGCTGLVANNVDLSYCGRNAISPVSAQFSVYGGSIHHIAQYAIDYEPNNLWDVQWCKGTISAVDFRVIGDSACPGYSKLIQYSPGMWVVSAPEYQPSARGPFTVTGCTGDTLWINFFGQQGNLTITNNRGDTPVSAQFAKPPMIYLKQCSSPTISGNVNYQLVSF